ncbi:MAG: hypothetical protein R3202_09925, partial [Candidatus Competibacterales bacterium]|nr:hypothetical protein [Candidatus Competibacterales bacterium]
MRLHHKPSLIGFLAVLLLGLALAAQAREWKAPANDGLHDPEVPAVELLQDPGTALSLLPADSAGNQVDWVQALQ